MKYILIALSAALIIFSNASAANTEYKITRIQYTANDGVRYDSARRNVFITNSQVRLNGSLFRLKAEISNTNYLGGDRDVYEQYQISHVGGSDYRLTDPSGNVSSAEILRLNPLRILFGSGVLVDLRQVSYIGWDRNPNIRTIQTIDDAINDVIENETEIGSLGF